MSYYPFPGGQRDGMVSKKMHFLSETTIPYSHLSILPDAVFFCHAAVPRTRDGNFLIQSLFFLLRAVMPAASGIITSLLPLPRSMPLSEIPFSPRSFHWTGNGFPPNVFRIL